MSLRARFLALFTAPAVVPLMAVGIFDYVHSTRTLEDFCAEQVERERNVRTPAPRLLIRA